MEPAVDSSDVHIGVLLAEFHECLREGMTCSIHRIIQRFQHITSLAGISLLFVLFLGASVCVFVVFVSHCRPPCV